MKTLMIYDSRFGNTEQIARAIADVLEKHGAVQLVPATEADTPDLRGVDLLVLGCPTQHHGLTPAMQTLFEHMPREALYGLATVTFDTRYRMVEFLSGSAAHLMAQRLKRAGARLLLPPESFFVHASEGPLEDGELERAGQWAERIFEQHV
jgi:flavodoxin